MPISAPVKAARSMAKLFRSACQVAKLKGTAAAISSSSTSGRRQSPERSLRQVVMKRI